MPHRSVVIWTLVMDGYTRSNLPAKALTLFREMVDVHGIEPNEVTLFDYFSRGCKFRVKCGCINSAISFFNEISEYRKNLVLWTSAFKSFAINGMGRKAVECFEIMEKAHLKLNRMTFLIVLNTCSHGELMEEGLNFFNKIANDIQLIPDIKHYGCLIDMLGRVGRLKEAENIVLQVSLGTTNIVIWRTLLSACSVHNNVEIGQRVTRKILEMERRHDADYVLISNIFVCVGRFNNAERLRKMIDKRIAFKISGYSLV